MLTPTPRRPSPSLVISLGPVRVAGRHRLCRHEPWRRHRLQAQARAEAGDGPAGQQADSRLPGRPPHRRGRARRQAGRGRGTGPKGETGAQGPGAQQITALQYVSNRELKRIATVGPWTVQLSCEDEGGPVVGELHIKGPGVVIYTASLAKPGGVATTYDAGGQIGSESSFGAGEDRQMNIGGFLTSGSTMALFDAQFAAAGGILPDSGGILPDCTATGDALHVP